VRRTAELLGNAPAAIPLAMDKIQAALTAVNPIALGMTLKRFTNLRSDFVAAVKASGLVPLKANPRAELSPEWIELFDRVSERRAHLGLSRLARYASAQGIAPGGINDEVVGGFIEDVRRGSLHRKPNTLYRQVTQIWNKLANDSDLGLKPVTVPSFRGPPKRIDQSLLPASFLEDRDRYLGWCAVSDEDRRSTHLSQATRNALRVSYAQYLRFLSENYPDLLVKTPEARLNRELIAKYVYLLRKTNQDLSIATSLHHLRFALRLICPKQDWSWLLTISKRLAAAAPRRPKKLGLVTSDQLYILGIELMDMAIAKAGDSTAISKATAMQYRDGLLIALLSVLALRRRTVTALKNGVQLFKRGKLWTLEIRPEDVKGKRALDFTLSLRLIASRSVSLLSVRSSDVGGVADELAASVSVSDVAAITPAFFDGCGLLTDCLIAQAPQSVAPTAPRRPNSECASGCGGMPRTCGRRRRHPRPDHRTRHRAASTPDALGRGPGQSGRQCDRADKTHFAGRAGQRYQRKTEGLLRGVGWRAHRGTAPRAASHRGW
jgi:hypothetical protein